jgi:hypothetical protein|tara:strand:+ start:6856 stop:7455 length:600 start_codon:yes stop_codon:yes gene_type:complete
MSHVSFYSDLEKEICDEIKAWSQHALEVPNEECGNLPVCAYAKKAWLDGKVGFSFKYGPGYQPLYSLISTYEDNYDVIVLVDIDYEEDPEKFHSYLVGLNEAISEKFFIQEDIWVMGFHPADETNEVIDDGSFEPLIENEYAMIFIQRLKKLQQSAKKLQKMGYYKYYFGDNNTPHVFKLRQYFYDKLTEERSHEQKQS